MRVALIAAITWREAARRKVLLAVLLLSAGYLSVFALGVALQFRGRRPPSPLIRAEIWAGLFQLALYGVAFLSALLAIVASLETVAGEIGSGTIQTLATKPMPRWQLLWGKWLGFAALLAVYVGVMCAVAAYVVAQGRGGYHAPHLAVAALLIWLESLVLLTVTLLFATVCSALASGVLALGLYGLAFIGGWVEQIGAILHHPATVRLGIITSLICPSEALWRRASFALRSPLPGALRFTPFATASVPSGAMVLYAVAYLLVALALALRHFSQRDL
ncbi:MAG: ABC transporter permease [Terriglobales bacterium]